MYIFGSEKTALKIKKMGQIENTSTTSEKNENGHHAIFFQAKYSEEVKFWNLKTKL